MLGISCWSCTYDIFNLKISSYFSEEKTYFQLMLLYTIWLNVNTKDGKNVIILIHYSYILFNKAITRYLLQKRYYSNISL